MLLQENLPSPRALCHPKCTQAGDTEGDGTVVTGVRFRGALSRHAIATSCDTLHSGSVTVPTMTLTEQSIQNSFFSHKIHHTGLR